MFYFTFKNINNKTLGLEVATRPSIPAPVQRGEYIQIAGRDGSLLNTDGTYENIEITVEMNTVSSRASLWNTNLRRAKNWLRGSGVLRFSDDPDVFFRVKAAGVGEVSRRAKRGGDFTAVFVCEPFTYYNAGTKEMTAQEAGFNPYYTCRPIYRITGNGTCTLTVNGKTMTALVGQNLTIDTEKLIAYRTDGTLQNTAVTGDYDDLILQPGENAIAITNGFTLTVQPNYRSL